MNIHINQHYRRTIAHLSDGNLFAYLLKFVTRVNSITHILILFSCQSIAVSFFNGLCVKIRKREVECGSFCRPYGSH